MSASETTRRPIVVGVDGSTCATAALDWAAAQADSDGLPLLIVNATSAPAPESSSWLAAHGIDRSRVLVQLKEQSRTLLRHSEQRIHTAHPDLEVRRATHRSDPRDALLDAAVEADLVVVGTRGLGPVRRLLLGSVSTTVSRQASCPTVVVRAGPPDPTYGVLVGVAGDAGDAPALDLAFRIATAHRLPVTALHCLWDQAGVDETLDLSPDEPGHELEWKLLEAAVGPVAARYPAVPVRQRLVVGFADECLARASQDAAVVVMGHHRRPFLNELIYGSAAPRVVEHARCSVAVVPLGAEPRPDDA